ncbi:MAG: hypothetical protein ACP5O0_08250 [Acidimicrobiales bacterium]
MTRASREIVVDAEHPLFSYRREATNRAYRCPTVLWQWFKGAVEVYLGERLYQVEPRGLK